MTSCIPAHVLEAARSQIAVNQQAVSELAREGKQAEALRMMDLHFDVMYGLAAQAKVNVRELVRAAFDEGAR